MYNELIKALRCKSNDINDHNACYGGTLEEIAADAREVAEARIAKLSLDCEMYQQKCMEMEAQLPKEGEWITTRTENHDGEIYCSVCDYDAPTEGDYRQVKTNFCPNCGARMETVTDCHALEEGER